LPLSIHDLTARARRTALVRKTGLQTTTSLWCTDTEVAFVATVCIAFAGLTEGGGLRQGARSTASLFAFVTNTTIRIAFADKPVLFEERIKPRKVNVRSKRHSCSIAERPASVVASLNIGIDTNDTQGFAKKIQRRAAGISATNADAILQCGEAIMEQLVHRDRSAHLVIGSLTLWLGFDQAVAEKKNLATDPGVVESGEIEGKRRRFNHSFFENENPDIIVDPGLGGFVSGVVLSQSDLVVFAPKTVCIRPINPKVNFLFVA
jgi:hypothetical protein